MDRIKVDPKYTGGSIRMAAASAAMDRGVPIDVVLNTGCYCVVAATVGGLHLLIIKNIHWAQAASFTLTDITARSSGTDQI